MATKTETFFLDTLVEAEMFAKSCNEDNMEAKVLPVEEQDGRKYYPVKVTFNPALFKK
jgi:hypothetical protein